jgi:hypothetical protein
VGSLESRLARLEARSKNTHPGAGGPLRSRMWEQFFHAHENARRETAGLEPLPDLPYTKEDYENDLDTLETTIPAYRASLGWQKEESQAVLDEWERDVRERIERTEHDRAAGKAEDQV